MHTITEFIAARASRIFIFGGLMFVVGSLAASYYYFKSPPKIEDYYHTNIRYQELYLKSSANKIVLVAGTKEYGIPIPLLKAAGKSDVNEVLNELESSNAAEVWLDDKEAASPFVRGIKTDNFYLPPEVGISKDIKDDESVVYIFKIIAVIGILEILFGVKKLIYDGY